jgi:hypothetical protein
MFLFLLQVAGAAEPAPVQAHVWVLTDPDGGVQVAKWGVDASALIQTGAWRVVDGDRLAQRVGESADALYRQCYTDVGCWRTVGRHAGIDGIVLVDRLDDDSVGLRVVDVGIEGAFRQVAGKGGDLPDMVGGLLLGEGTLRVEGLPLDCQITLNDGAPLFVGKTWETRLPSGKHTLLFQKEGYSPTVDVAMVYTAQTALVYAELEGGSTQAKRDWVRWVAVAGIGAGLLGVTVAAAAAGATPAGSLR